MTDIYPNKGSFREESHQTVAVDALPVGRKLEETSDDLLIPLVLLLATHPLLIQQEPSDSDLPFQLAPRIIKPSLLSRLRIQRLRSADLGQKRAEKQEEITTCVSREELKRFREEIERGVPSRSTKRERCFGGFRQSEGLRVGAEARFGRSPTIMTTIIVVQ